MSAALAAEVKKLEARIAALEARPVCKCESKPVDMVATVAPRRPIMTLKKSNG